MITANAHPLVGQFFLTFTGKPSEPETRVQHQGDVRARIGGTDADPIFLCIFRDWALGDATNGEAIPLSHMSGWEFYADADDWRQRGADLLARESWQRRGEPRVGRSYCEHGCFPEEECGLCATTSEEEGAT